MAQAPGKKPATIHLQKAFGCVKTAREVWREEVLRGHLCTHCRTTKAIGTINLFWPADEFEADQPTLAVKMFLRSPAGVPWVEFNVCGEPKKYVPLPVAFFCAFCRKNIEQWAARAPSKVVAEVRMGPDESRMAVAMPGDQSA